MPYATLPEFTAYVASEINADDAWLADVLASAEAAINDHCQRSFNVPAVTSIERFYVPSQYVVHIHDIVDTTNLVIEDDGVAVALADVQLEPVNRLSWSGQSRPYRRIRRLGQCWSPGNVDHGKATVSVTSNRWGWPAVPANVKQATLILGKDLAHAKSTRNGILTGEFGVARLRENPVVVGLLEDFDRQRPIRVG